jgi:soluble lytic murein transglycosylase-like protein
MPKPVEPWMIAAGVAGMFAVAGVTYGIVTLAGSAWPAVGDGCSVETYRAVLGPKTSSSATVERAWTYMPLARYAARYFNIDENLLAALVHTESGWNPNAGSSVAVGLTQHIASTAAARFKQLAERNQWPFGQLSSSNDPQSNGKLADLGVAQWVDRTDPKQSLWLGAASLRTLLDAGKGTEWALAAYNGGPGVANKPVSERPVETQNYVPGVLKRLTWYQQLDAACRGLA